MKLIQIGTDAKGINTYPICVAWYDTVTHKGSYCVIKPVEYFIEDESKRIESPTRSDAEQYGLNVSQVARHLNEKLFGCTVYTTNAIETIEHLNRIYQSCGDTPTYNVENLCEKFSQTEFNQYETEILYLRRISETYPLHYCIKLSELIEKITS